MIPHIRLVSLPGYLACLYVAMDWYDDIPDVIDVVLQGGAGDLDIIQVSR